MSIQGQKNSISTRQKIGVLTKKFLAFWVTNPKKAFSLTQLLQQLNKSVKQTKKCIDIIYMLEIMGVITQYAKQCFIYTGLKGISSRLYQYQVNGKCLAPLFQEDIQFEGKRHQVKASQIQGAFLAQLFFKVSLSPNRSITKSQLQVYFEEITLKLEGGSKGFIGEILNVLSFLNLIQRNQSSQVINGIGPQLKTYNQQLELDPILQYKLISAENQFRSFILQTPPQLQDLSKQPPFMPITNLPQLSYCLIKNKNWEFPVKKPMIIIGRGGTYWDVDLQIDRPKISRQHALIAYNFHEKSWWVKCLSKGNTIRVDNMRLCSSDKQIKLQNNTMIRIGGQWMVFWLPIKH